MRKINTVADLRELLKYSEDEESLILKLDDKYLDCIIATSSAGGRGTILWVEFEEKKKVKTWEEMTAEEKSKDVYANWTNLQLHHRKFMQECVDETLARLKAQDLVGKKVRLTEEYKKDMTAGDCDDLVKEFYDCVGTVECLLDYGTQQGPEVDVRWEPSKWRYGYHPSNLEVVE